MVPARLTSSRDIKATLATGRSAAGRCAVLRLREGAAADGAPRLAVVAGRKVGGAVVRNRAKRRLRAAAASLTWPVGHDAVLLARRQAVTASFADLVTDLRGLLRRVTPAAGAP